MTDRDRETVRLRFPAISGAFQLHHEAGHRLGEVQARILARQSGEAISTFCGVPADMIDWY